jgi:hypothetical protein
MIPPIMTTTIAPRSAGTNETPAMAGPNVPNKYSPSHAPTNPAKMAAAQLPGILNGDSFSATVPMTNAIRTAIRKEVMVIENNPFLPVYSTIVQMVQMQKGIYMF